MLKLSDYFVVECVLLYMALTHWNNQKPLELNLWRKVFDKLKAKVHKLQFFLHFVFSRVRVVDDGILMNERGSGAVLIISINELQSESNSTVNRANLVVIRIKIITYRRTSSSFSDKTKQNKSTKIICLILESCSLEFCDWTTMSTGYCVVFVWIFILFVCLFVCKKCVSRLLYSLVVLKWMCRIKNSVCSLNVDITMYMNENIYTTECAGKRERNKSTQQKTTNDPQHT